MTLLHRLASIVRWVLYKKKLEQQLDEELQVFLDMSAKQKVQDGVPPSEARRLAMLELGGIEQAKEHVRTFRYGALLDQLGKDLRFALRTFAKQPGFVVVVVLTLALGIGANTAIFSLIDALMLRWLPVHNPDELVQVVMAAPGSNPPFDTFSYPIARGLAEQTEIFAGVAGFSSFPFDVGNGDSLSRVSGAVVTGGYYETFGLTAVVGRLLGKEDDEPGAPPVAVISYGFWEREFAHNPGAIGQTLPVNGVPVTLIGVSPAGFVGANVGAVADITIPAAALPQIHPPSAGLLGAGNFWMRILARPSSGVSVQQAGGRLAAIWPQMAERVIASHWPASQKKEFAESVFQLVPGGTGYSILRSMYAKPLKVLMGMVALVLFIACANVANLLLVRGSARQREMAVRLAIGAGRGRIVRQLLTESILLSLIGAACGIALSWLSSRFLLGILSTGSFQVLFDLTPNLHVLGFTAAVAIAIAILFGLAPAFYATSTGPSMALKQDSRSSSRSRLMPFLVTLQVALTLVLVIGASLLVRTLQNLQNLDPGFSREGVLLVDLEGRRTGVPIELLDEVRRIPGIVSASLSTHTPLSGAFWSEPAVPLGQPLPARDSALFVAAGPGFFETMQTPVLAGRSFTDRDSRSAPAVAVINEAYAVRYFQNQNPIGQHLSARVRGEDRILEIVGLVKNVKATDLRRPPRSTVYVSYAQLTGNFPTTMEIRVTGSIGEASAAIKKVVQAKLPNSLVDVRPLSAQVEAVMVQERMMATLASGFGALALALACIGLYGLLAYRVARQTKEIAIRVAIGAQQKRVFIMVLRGAVGLVLAGIGLGLPSAWAATRWIEAMLFQMDPTDAATITGAVLLVISVSLLAAYLPARRAAQVEPMTALRHD